MKALDAAIPQNDLRAANIRAGYVYVIRNPGAFGPNMVKIGMTRRLEPMDRVRELGDASVPFPFEGHALSFSEDAVTWACSKASRVRLPTTRDRLEALANTLVTNRLRDLLDDVRASSRLHTRTSHTRTAKRRARTPYRTLGRPPPQVHRRLTDST